MCGMLVRACGKRLYRGQVVALGGGRTEGNDVRGISFDASWYRRWTRSKYRCDPYRQWHPTHTSVCEKNTPPEKMTRQTFGLENNQIRGWRAVSAVELQGKGLRKRSVYFKDTGIMSYISWSPLAWPHSATQTELWFHAKIPWGSPLFEGVHPLVRSSSLELERPQCRHIILYHITWYYVVIYYVIVHYPIIILYTSL